eukprot:49991-Pelagomonas_calceolata.AAC.1
MEKSDAESSQEREGKNQCCRIKALFPPLLFDESLIETRLRLHGENYFRGATPYRLILHCY